MKTALLRKKLGLVVLVAASGVSPIGYADTLVSSVNNLLGVNGLVFPDAEVQGKHPETHFQSSSLSALGTLTSTLASSSNNIPVVSTAPGLGFVYNSGLGTFEPTTNNNVGSLYLEGGKTNGAGKFAVGVNYSYVDYQTINGQNLSGYHETLNHQQVSFEHPTIDINFNKFNISSSIISSYFTYGVTDKWDVNVMIPVMVTDLDVQATATINNKPLSVNGVNVDVTGRPLPPGATPRFTTYSFDGKSSTANFSATGHKVGVGDLVVRNKYQFYDSDGLNMSGLLKVTFPTGDAANFQGTGDYYIQPYLAASESFGDFDFHGNAGVDVDVSYSERSRARYGIGVSYKFLEKSGFMLDLIGSSNVTSQTVSTQVPQYNLNYPGNQIGVNTVTTSVNTNIIDLSMGFKTTLFKQATGYFNFLVPLNNDGLRADYIPSAGLQMPL